MSAIYLKDERDREDLRVGQAPRGLDASLRNASSLIDDAMSGTCVAREQARIQPHAVAGEVVSLHAVPGDRAPTRHGVTANALAWATLTPSNRADATDIPGFTPCLTRDGGTTQGHPGAVHAARLTGKHRHAADDVSSQRGIPLWLLISLVTHAGLFTVLPGSTPHKTQAAASTEPLELEVEWETESAGQEEVRVRDGSAEAVQEDGAASSSLAARSKREVSAPTRSPASQRTEAKEEQAVASAAPEVKPEPPTPNRVPNEMPSQHESAALDAVPAGALPSADGPTGVSGSSKPSDALAAMTGQPRAGSDAGDGSRREGSTQMAARRGLEGGTDLRGLAAGYLASLGRFIARSQHYPSAARRAEMEGTVLLDLAIDGSGRILGTRVRRSSGYPLLDEAATASVAALGQLPAPPGALGWTKRALTLPIVYQLR